jgi:hypothetical protein
VVSVLLAHRGDPTILDTRGRPAYFLAKNKETKDAFRRYRGVVGEDALDWATTGT